MDDISRELEQQILLALNGHELGLKVEEIHGKLAAVSESLTDTLAALGNLVRRGEVAREVGGPRWKRSHPPMKPTAGNEDDPVRGVLLRAAKQAQDARDAYVLLSGMGLSTCQRAVLEQLQRSRYAARDALKHYDAGRTRA